MNGTSDNIKEEIEKLSKEIGDKLRELKKFTIYHKDVLEAYNRFVEEFREEFTTRFYYGGEERLYRHLKDLLRRVSDFLVFAEDYKARYERIEKVKKAMEEKGIKNILFLLVDKDGTFHYRLVSINDIHDISKGKLYVDFPFTISGMLRHLEKEGIGKVAICKPIDYKKYECDFNRSKEILDYLL